MSYFIGGNFEDKETKMFQVDIETGLNNQSEKSDVIIYPNPANDFLIIEANESISEIVISDMRGGIVFEKSNLSKTNLTVDLNKMPKGINIVRIKLEQKFQYYKIIIK